MRDHTTRTSALALLATVCTALVCAPAATAGELQFSLNKLEYAPGEAIRIVSAHDCGGTATSPGFVAPIVIIYRADYPANAGTGNVIQTPGYYNVTLCGGTRAFRVLGGPPPTKEPLPSNKPRPRVVVPRGAADTGGGGTATN